MHIGCSTSCFANYPLKDALEKISNLEFTQVELSVSESGLHVKPSEIMEDPVSTIKRIRGGPNLKPIAFNVDLASEIAPIEKQLAEICRLAKTITVTLVTIRCAPIGTPLEQEIARLKSLTAIAAHEGVTLSIENEVGRLAEAPSSAVALCEAVPGLGLTLDPSHFVCGPHQDQEYGEVFPFVQHVQLRDTGKGPNQQQVPIGQGLIEYGKVISQLARVGYGRSICVEIIDGPDVDMDVEAEVRKLKLLLETLL